MSTTPKRDSTVADFTHGDATRETWRTSEPRLPLFSVERPATDDLAAETIVYTIPAKPNAGLALDFLRMGRRVGAEPAISWLIEEAIGPDGYDDLVAELEAYEGDGAAVLKGVSEKIQLVVMGGLEAPK